MAKIDMPWEDAIQRVLSEADGALHYADIAERISSQGLRRSVGATPANTVNAYLTTSLREGKKSPYLRVGRGEYTLKIAAEKTLKPRLVQSIRPIRKRKLAHWCIRHVLAA